MGKSRDFGISGGAGKGDSDRVTNRSAYADNYAEINWGPRIDKTAKDCPFQPIPPPDICPMPCADTIADDATFGIATPVTNDLHRE